jgi:KDO2-lipid IV(A) lauroyltransferase
MAKLLKKPAMHWLIYLVVRSTVCVLQAVPMRWAFGFAGWLAWLAYRIDKRHRRVAAENLRFAFPHHSEEEIDRLVRGCYQHFAAVVIEIALLPRKLQVANWRRYAELRQGEQIVPVLLADRPALIVCGHFGNWEMAGYALGLFGFPTFAIARVLDNPHLERFLKQFRQRTGQTIIAKKDDFDRLTEVMKAGGKVATLADQDAGPRGVFVNFFGRPASAHKAVALMALEFNAVMIVSGTPRIAPVELGTMRYAIECEDVIDPQDYANQPNAIKAITQRYHDALERLIRRHPEQYFWLHRRWKTPPPPKRTASR